MRNAISWFEIPVKNLNRAKKFYETIFGIAIKITQSVEGDYKKGIFPYDMNNDGVGGTLVEEKDYNPSQQGVIIYLNRGENLSVPLASV